METGTFLNDDVMEHINKDFVSIKYETGKDSEQFPRFNVRATPTYVFLDADGNEVHRIVGFYNPAEFIVELEGVRKKSVKM